jgi:hypothetical protein
MSSFRLKMVPTLLMLQITVAVLCGHPFVLTAESGEKEIRTTTQFSYRLCPEDTPEIARTLALYGAKYKAALWLAKQLAGQGLLKEYGDRHREMFCLVADELQYDLIDDSFSQNGGIYSVNIESRVSLADFVRAEMNDAALEKKELAFSLQEELEPVLSAALEPGRELSRAHRYIRNQHWRKAIIYIDLLEKKYPCWSDLLFAKGLAFEGEHEMQHAMRAFSKSCERGNPQACKKVASAAN